jgi:hypothetical protein
VDSAITLIVKRKYISKTDVQKFKMKLKAVLLRILGYKQLIREVEWLRQIKYDKENEKHEELLMKLWSLLKPDVDLRDRVSKQWQELGFQGDDPATDFRGMGVLGLIQLIYFCERHPHLSKRIYSRSFHPRIDYPFAVAGINMTSLARELLRKGTLRPHFLNSSAAGVDCPLLCHFHEIYSSIFVLFDEMWFKEDPADGVMAFNGVREKLVEQLESFFRGNENAVLPLLTSDIDLANTATSFTITTE